MNNITILTSVLNALDTITVQGYDNHYKIIASINDIQKVIENLKKEETSEETADEAAEN